MGKLNILGATRVNALVSILREKERADIEIVRKQVNEEEITVGTKCVELISEFKKMAETLIGLGCDNSTVRNVLTLNSENLIQVLRNRRFTDESTRIRAEYKAKEHKLWLCETLEEAKQIVGIE